MKQPVRKNAVTMHGINPNGQTAVKRMQKTLGMINVFVTLVDIGMRPDQ